MSTRITIKSFTFCCERLLTLNWPHTFQSGRACACSQYHFNQYIEFPNGQFDHSVSFHCECVCVRVSKRKRKVLIKSILYSD